MKKGKLLVFSAPSGSGKTTIVRYLMNQISNLHFSVSATSRQPRGTEKNGIDYFFLTPDDFRQKVKNNEFLEYEEVYTDKFYGTLKSQVENQLNLGENVVLDIDVKGGINIKNIYKDQVLTVFIMPPSVEVLEQRLRGRATDSEETIRQRIDKAAYEITFSSQFDVCIINDDLATAQQEAFSVVRSFLNS